MHITFLGLDNARELVYRHCRQMLLNLMIVLGDHGDHLTVSSILMNSKTDAREFGLSLPPLPNVLIRDENMTIVPVSDAVFHVQCISNYECRYCSPERRFNDFNTGMSSKDSESFEQMRHF